MNVTTALAPVPNGSTPPSTIALGASGPTGEDNPAGLGVLAPKSGLAKKTLLAQFKAPITELRSTCKSDDPSEPPPCVDMTPAQGQKLLQIAKAVYKKGNSVPANPIEFTFKGTQYLAKPYNWRGPMTYDVSLEIREKNDPNKVVVFESGQQIRTSADFPSVRASGIGKNLVDPLLDAATKAIMTADKKGLLKK
jgi:hypothetical protein